KLEAHTLAQRLRDAAGREVHATLILVESRKLFAGTGLHERDLELGVARAQRQRMGSDDRRAVAAREIGLRSKLGVSGDPPVDEGARNRALPERELGRVDERRRGERLRLLPTIDDGLSRLDNSLHGRQRSHKRSVFAQTLDKRTCIHLRFSWLISLDMPAK